jgi:hypothetical protein
MMVILAQKMFV